MCTSEFDRIMCKISSKINQRKSKILILSKINEIYNLYCFFKIWVILWFKNLKFSNYLAKLHYNLIPRCCIFYFQLSKVRLLTCSMKLQMFVEEKFSATSRPDCIATPACVMIDYDHVNSICYIASDPYYAP